VTLVDPADRWVRVYVQEDRIAAVALGMPAEVRTDTYPDKAYRGEVTWISPQAEFTPKNVQTPAERVRLVYAVKVRVLDDPAYELKPGMPADVRLDLPAAAS
jgi:HlyD family secretion protein